jgi:hypothetical protein
MACITPGNQSEFTDLEILRLVSTFDAVAIFDWSIWKTRMKFTTILLIAVLALFFIAVAAQSEPEEVKHEETKSVDPDAPDTTGEEALPDSEVQSISGLLSSPDVTSSIYFPTRSTKSNHYTTILTI